MSKHTNWMRSRNNDPERTKVVQFEGRKLLGTLMEMLTRSGQKQGVLRRTLDDGTVVVARFDGTTPMVEVHAPAISPAPPTDDKDKIATWVPRGFVLYPVSDEVPAGWGLPVVQDEEFTPYETTNLAPGLETTRWTEGGKLGQVLLSKDVNAGYPAQKPSSLLPPQLFHPKYGLRPTTTNTPAQGSFAAYRLEHADYSSQSPTASATQQVTDRDYKRTVFELTNAQRAGVPVGPLFLPIRGFYDGAQASSEVQAAGNILGHYYQGFPPTYRTEDDRVSKDGITITTGLFLLTPSQQDDRNQALSGGENVAASLAEPATVIGADPNGYPIYSVVPGPGLTASETFDAWLDSPPHKANIESPLYSAGGFSRLSIATLGVGIKGAFYTQHFTQRDAWISAGNVAGHSSLPGVPILSWFGPNSMNLNWETWPVTPTYYSTRTGVGEYTLTAGIFALHDFVADLGGTAVTSFLYIDHPNNGTDTRTRPLFNNRIFARGRCIAIAPRGGLVWAAGVQKFEGETPAGPGFHRLVALVHEQTDQPEDAIANGMTSALRVWWVDLPDFLGFAANPQAPIRGVYGEEDAATWPWLTLNSPYSWRGGTLVDMATSDAGSEPDMLKYASMWRFSPDGTKAMCLRDFATIDEMKQHFVLDGRLKFGNAPQPVGTEISPGDVYLSAGQFGQFVGGPRVVSVMLAFGGDETGLTVSRSTSAPNAGGVAHRLLDTFVPETGLTLDPSAWLRPAAVDFAADGTPLYAFHVHAFYPGAFAVASGASGIALPSLRQGVLFSADWDAAWPDAKTRANWYSGLAVDSQVDVFAMPATVLDVRDKVFAAYGIPCPLTDDGPGPFPAGHENYPDTITYGSDGVGYRAGTFTTACLACAATPAEYVIRLWRNDVMLIDETVTNSDNTLNDLRLAAVCDFYGDPGDPLGVPVYISDPYFWWGWCPESANPNLSASYQRNKAGDWVATLLYMPQATWTTTFDPGDDVFYCGTNQEETSRCFNDCGTTPAFFDTFTFAGAEVCRDGGGWMRSSFADQASLGALMNIPGANPRSLYARVV